MQRYYEIDKETLGILTDEEVETLIEIEVAHEGITPVEEPISVESPEVDIKKTEKAFQVSHNTSFYFKNRKDAEKVISMELYKSDYNYSCGYNNTWLESLEDRTITEELFYKEEDINKVQSLLQEQERIKDQNQKAKSAYDTFVRKTGEIRKKIWDTVKEARDFISRIDFAKRRYQRYVELADGDNLVAAKFFTDAFKDEPEILELLDSINGIVVKDGINMEDQYGPDSPG